MTIFVGVRELSNNTKRVLEKLNKGDTIIVTDKGQPKAAMMGITPNYTFEEVYKLMQDYEAELTLKSIQAEGEEKYPNGMSMDEINALIKEARADAKRKKKQK